jgi:hypothetical protein
MWHADLKINLPGLGAISLRASSSIVLVNVDDFSTHTEILIHENLRMERNVVNRLARLRRHQNFGYDHWNYER